MWTLDVESLRVRRQKISARRKRLRYLEQRVENQKGHTKKKRIQRYFWKILQFVFLPSKRGFWLTLTIPTNTNRLRSITCHLPPETNLQGLSSVKQNNKLTVLWTLVPPPKQSIKVSSFTSLKAHTTHAPLHPHFSTTLSASSATLFDYRFVR